MRKWRRDCLARSWRVIYQWPVIKTHKHPASNIHQCHPGGVSVHPCHREVRNIHQCHGAVMSTYHLLGEVMIIHLCQVISRSRECIVTPEPSSGWRILSNIPPPSQWPGHHQENILMDTTMLTIGITEGNLSNLSLTSRTLWDTQWRSDNAVCNIVKVVIVKSGWWHVWFAVTTSNA